jgi:hypothetical protein
VSLYVFGLEHIVTTKGLQTNQNKFPWFIRVQYDSYYKHTSLGKTTEEGENYTDIKLSFHPFNIMLSTNFGCAQYAQCVTPNIYLDMVYH